MKINYRNHWALAALLVLGSFAIVRGTLISETTLTKEADRLSYGLGLQIGKSFDALNIDVNTAIFMRGLKDASSGREPLLTAEQIRQTAIIFMTRTMPQSVDGKTGIQAKKDKNKTGILLPEKINNGISDEIPERFEY
jgi:FKBP-type peptidyl-prolyl cis-trans isomerase FklB